MTPKTSLLTALRTYRPRDGHDPLENFITEAFTWLLINHPGFGRFYLERITIQLGLPPAPLGQSIEWTTRLNIGGVYPDLVGQTESHTYIFEHKAWSHLHGNQLANYRREAAQAFGDAGYHLILVVGGSHLLDQDPDLGLCWHHIHAWIGEWRSHKDFEPDHLFSDFQGLLESEGMGPPAPLSHETILAYKPARAFEPTLSALVQKVFHHPWADLFPSGSTNPALPWHRSLYGGQDPWGRFGFCLMGEELKEWSPGLFVGFVVDPRDHAIEWSSQLCPDFNVILDVNIQLHADYERLPAYVALRDALHAAVQREAPDFYFLDHLSTSPNPNRWHPIHVRKPMLELFRGTQHGEEQQVRFIEAASRILKLVADCSEFWAFRSILHQSTRNASHPLSILPLKLE